MMVEILSGASAYDIFLEQVLRPVFANLRSEAMQSLDVNVEAFVDEERVEDVHIAEVDANSKSPLGNGVVRARLKKAGNDWRFHAQAIIRDFAADTGYSGFEISGRIRPSEQQSQIAVTGRTNLYNVWIWLPKFTFSD